MDELIEAVQRAVEEHESQENAVANGQAPKVEGEGSLFLVDQGK